MGYIYYWQSKETDSSGSTGEYIIMTDDEMSQNDIEGNTIPNWEFHSKMDIPGKFPNGFPTDYTMMKR
jgi:hypothetical protein